MNNKIFYSILIIGLAIGLCIYFYPELKGFTENIIFKTESKTTSLPASSTTKSTSKSITAPITQATFPSYAQSQPIINDIPDGTEILLKLYNFNTGERQWDVSYIVKKGSVIEGTLDNPELTLTLSSKYLADLNQIGFCATVKKANANGDLGMEFGVSELTLAWKYRAMMKYKECF